MGRARAWFVLLIGALGLILAAEVQATPLYGGYNGESTIWTEYKIGEFTTTLVSSSVIVGSDSEERSWTRIRIFLIPFFIRLEYNRDYLGVESVVFSTLFPWPLQFGSEGTAADGESPLWWVTSYLLLGVGGIDSEGNSWTETGVPGVYGVGSDVNDNWWFWFKAGNLLWGVGEDFTVEWNRRAVDQRIARLQGSLHSLKDHFDGQAGQALAERLTSAQFVDAARECLESLPRGGAYSSFTGVNRDGMAAVSWASNSACGAVSAQLFSGGTGDDLKLLADDFLQVMQPLLREGVPAH